MKKQSPPVFKIEEDHLSAPPDPDKPLSLQSFKR
jgi:hypothetical protein